MNFLQMKNMTLGLLDCDSEEDLGSGVLLEHALNEGYDRLMQAYRGVHVGMADVILPLVRDRDVPELPEWMHTAAVWWAMWMLCRGGGAAKRELAETYRQEFRRVQAMIYNLPPSLRKPCRLSLPAVPRKRMKGFSPFEAPNE